ncbi:MAG: tRNA(Ile)-lysidine synthase, partial [bacterium]
MASSRKGGPESTPAAPAAIAGAGADRSLEETAGLIDLVSACLESHLPAAGRLVVGYSGGLDSSVLLHLLADLRARRGFTLAAVYVHHGLSPQADDWARHCARVCGALDVPLQVARVEVEAAARAARYAVFADIDADAVALAHHRDDQAETVLAQLLRGGGAKGLAAMPACRRLQAGGPLLLRPLLSAPRAHIAAWARARRLCWVEDESNLHTHLARNLLRHQVLPLLETRFAAPGATLARAAERFAETAALLDDLADLDAGAVLTPEGLSIAALAGLSPARARNLLRRRLELAGADLHAEALREGLRQLLEARRDARVMVDFGTVGLRRHR